MKPLTLAPQLPSLGEHPETAATLITVNDLKQALQRGEISEQFALIHCPSKHLKYVLGGVSHG